MAGSGSNPTSLSLEQVLATISEAMLPCRFFAAPPLALTWEFVPNEEVPWEIFHGRLLDAAHTRQRQWFLAWNIYLHDAAGKSAEPLLSVKLDWPASRIQVVRGLLCHVWETFDEDGITLESRETTRWVRELVATIFPLAFTTGDALREELALRISQAFVGTSRLPLTSLEAPLPGFSLGQLHYVRRDLDSPATPPMNHWRELVDQGLSGELSRRQTVKLLEFGLRAMHISDLPHGLEAFVTRWRSLGPTPTELLPLCRRMFQEISLSPWTDFVEKFLAFLNGLVSGGHIAVEEQIDFLGWLLRQLGRHLTAYDLITFHHRGANYPDALLLDAALKEYVRLCEGRPELFTTRQRRRALRQGCLIRHFYQGLAVPDAPTSPGENARVLPQPHVRVPEEQILNPGKRHRRLYDGDPLAAHLQPRARQCLQQSLEDLQHPDELRELGIGLFIDRPLGLYKEPGEPDQTPLLAYEAFSRQLAKQRVLDLAKMAGELGLSFDADRCMSQLDGLAVVGLPVNDVWTRDGALVSLADARRVADDFILLRTTPSSASEFLALADWRQMVLRRSLRHGPDPRHMLIVLAPSLRDRRQPVLAVFDAQMRRIAELAIGAGFEMRGEVEWPMEGLEMVRVWG